MAELIKNFLSLSVPGETPMQVYIVYPSHTGHKLPGLLVFQEAFGVNGHIRDVADRFAAEGYYVVAPELFHRTAAKGTAISYNEFEKVRPHLQAITLQGLQDDVTTAFQFMSRQNEVDEHRIASIGFCMGGKVSFVASTVLPLKAAACFYGSGISDFSEELYQRISCPLLFCWGGQDGHITKDKVDQVTGKSDEAGKDYVNVVFSKAGHAFFCDARSNYHPASAKEAWELVKIFFKTHV